MNVQKAFHLIDCATALAISLMAMSAVIQLGIQTYQHLSRDWESRVAREILGHIHTLPRAALSNFPERHFDFRGLPVGQADKFQLRIVPETSETQIRYLCTLTWLDFDGKPRTMLLQRLLEAPDE